MIEFLKSFADWLVEYEPIMLNGSVQNSIYKHIDAEKYRLNAFLDMIFLEKKGYSVTEIVFFLSFGRESIEYISKWMPSKYRKTILKYLATNNLEVARSFMIQNMDTIMTIRVSTAKGKHTLQTSLGAIIVTLLDNILSQDGEYAFEHIYQLADIYTERFEALEALNTLHELSLQDQEVIKFLLIVSSDFLNLRVHDVFPIGLIEEAIYMAYGEENQFYLWIKHCREMQSKIDTLEEQLQEANMKIMILEKNTFAHEENKKIIYVGNSARKNDIAKEVSVYTHDYTILDGFDDINRIIPQGRNADVIIVDTQYIAHSVYHLLMNNYKSKLVLLNRSGMLTLKTTLQGMCKGENKWI